MAGSHPKKSLLVERLVATWLKYDPFVRLVVRNEHESRRDVMLNLLGPQAARRHFGQFPPKIAGQGVIFPSTVRKVVARSINDPQSRLQLILKLIHWATDPYINNRYIKSHLTRMQIVRSLLGTVFFRASHDEEQEIMKGLQYLLTKKNPLTGDQGEQSNEVLSLLLDRVSDLLVYNQRVIVTKAISEAEEHMRAGLLRQIQNLGGEKHTSPFFWPEMSKTRGHELREKFPLPQDTSRLMEDILVFFTVCNRPDLAERALTTAKTLDDIRHPLTLTQEPSPR